MASSGKRRCFKTAGQIYYGDVEEHADGRCVRHGLGLHIVTAVTVTGDQVVWGRYQGAWKQGKMTGSGVYRWSDGSVYEGNFVDGQLHGHGRLTWPEGSVYDGMWHNGEMHGQGTFTCGFDKLENHGIFWRNCLKDHTQKWVDQVKQREAFRQAHLKIGSYPAEKIHLHVSRCSSDELRAKVLSVLQEPPYLMPLIVPTRSCTVEPAPGRSAAPLGILEAHDYGCTLDSTIHLGHAAAEQKRKRDISPLFRNAMRTALLEARLLTLVWGDDTKENPQDDQAAWGAPDGTTVADWGAISVDPVPEAWSLNNFFSPLVLPTDIFDFRHFHGSGMADSFLPEDQAGLVARKAEAAKPKSRLPSKESVASKGSKAPDEEPQAAHPPMDPPPRVHTLQMALMSMKRIPDDASDDAVRQHVIRRFSAAMPLHRVAVIVVSTPPQEDK
eukprot:TRINITY_DN92313_c0_g1_i1.p1 TRINITY_DN92313_c0_g1~~TRINITY_DN92313_c0_g1_i1.p1  ORF type:complete len:441 (-),score=93.84 TRINITY_DN92313_c0_g1_i1:224-1546(-)